MTQTRKNKPHHFLLKLSDNLEVKACEFSVDPPPVTAVAFKGGGARIFLYMAAILFAEQHGYFKNVKEYSGSSSGSLMAVLQAIPFIDPQQKQRIFETVYELDAHDSLDDSVGWDILSLFSKSLNWLSRKASDIHLKPISSLLTIVSNLTSPITYAAFYNLMTKGGMYRGEKFEKGFQQAIHESVENYINEAWLVADWERRAFLKEQLVANGIYVEVDGKYEVTTELTFNHFAALAKIFDGAFREIVLCGVRLSDKKFVLFKEGGEFGDLPVYKATRAAISLPVFHIPAIINGEKFIDGGAEDNCPIRHAKTSFVPTALQRRFGITADHSKLAVRVEYPNALDTFLWNPRKPTGWLHRVKAAILSRLTAGIDTYETQRINEDYLEEKFAHRTMQMEDFHLKRTQFHVSRKDREDYLQRSIPRVSDFIEPRINEKAVIIHYRVLSDMSLVPVCDNDWSKVMLPLEVQVRLLVDLQDQSIPVTELFSLCGRECEVAVLEKLRESMIIQLCNSSDIMKLSESPCEFLKRLDGDKSFSSAKILKRMPSVNVDEFKRDAEVQEEPVTAERYASTVRVIHNSDDDHCRISGLRV